MIRKFLGALVFFILFASIGYGDSLYEVQTGKNNSASWQFTNLLTGIWKQKYKDKSDYFVPKYVDGFYNRLQNLDKQQSKLAIAPLKSIENLPITGMKVKIAVVLWNMYLIPIDSLNVSKEISLQANRPWLISEDSLIVPSFLNSLRSVYLASPGDLTPELADLVQSITWMPKNEDAEAGNPGSFSVQTGLIDSHQPLLGRASFSSDRIRLLTPQTIPEVLASGEEGFLLYEMIGPFTTFLNRLKGNYTPISLDNTFVSSLLKFNWFLQPFTISRINVRTVGVTYALFVHEMEDPEFVKELIQVLAAQPQSYFPKAYLLENLSINQTKEVSPLFLHEASIKFFQID
jgi:hypothetical protein